MWIGIFSGLFSLPALLGLWAGLREIMCAFREARPIRRERVGLAALILTGRWWMPFLRRVDPDEPKPLVPRRRGTVAGTGGVRLEWEQLGPDHAPVVLLSHGWSLTHDTWYYQKIALAGEFRVIVWNMRGTGLSSAPRDEDYSLEASADDLAAVFEAVEAGRNPRGCVLAGHSVGAMILPLFGERHPDLMRSVRGLAMIGGTDTPLLETMWGREWLKPMRPWFWEPLARAMGRFPLPFEAFARLIWQMGCVHAALMFGTHVGRESRGQDNLVADRCAHFSMRAAGRGALACFDYDTRALLPALTLPVLLLTGDCDRNMPPEIQRGMATRLPQAELILIENCGHLSLLECHEEVSSALRGFARRCLRALPSTQDLE